MYCERCGEKLKDNALFCEKCGTKVQQSKDEDSETKTQKISSAQSLELDSQSSLGKPDTSGVDVSAYPTAVQPPLKQPGIQQTTPMPSVAEQKQYIAEPTAQSANTNQAERKLKMPIIVAVVAAAIALVAVIILIMTFVFGESEPTTNDSAKSYAAQKEQELASNSATNQQKESTTQSSSSSSIEDVINSPNGFILPESDSRYYSDSELNALTDYQLYLARNEIYARYGRGFNNQDLQDYFHNKNWYTVRYSPDSFDSIVTLNDFEKKNADAMLAIEKRRGSSYLS